MSILKLKQLLAMISCTYRLLVHVIKQDSQADISITVRCMKKHTNIWHSSDLLPLNKNKRKCKETPLQYMIGGILFGMS